MMSINTIFVYLIVSSGMFQDIPYRDEDTYKLSLKMEFKVEPTPDINRVEYVSKKNYSSEPQLYLKASFELLSILPNDNKLKVIDNNGKVLLSKKLKSPNTFLLKLGYAHHMKQKKSPNYFIIQFIDTSKKVASQVVLEIREDGDFVVNGKRFGKV